jgi:hypothetical protein
MRQGILAAVLAFAGVAGSLLWLVGICALRRPLKALPGLPRAGLVLGLGAVAAMLAWWPLLWAGLGGEAHALRVAAVGLGGVCFAALLWAWLDLRARIWHPADASARLAELQSRIRPHFLFNALNTALALVRVDPARACSSASPKPSSASQAAARGTRHSPQHFVRGAGCRSRRVTCQPWRARTAAETAPAGPPPTTQAVRGTGGWRVSGMGLTIAATRCNGRLGQQLLAGREFIQNP